MPKLWMAVETTHCLLFRAIPPAWGRSVNAQRCTGGSEIDSGHRRLCTSLVSCQHHVARRWYLDECGVGLINRARACWRIRSVATILVVAVLTAVFTRAIECDRTRFNDNQHRPRMRMPSRTPPRSDGDIRHRNIGVV